MPAGSLHAVSRTVTVAPGAVIAGWGWVETGRPLSVPGAHAAAFHLAGLGAMLAGGLLAWSVLVLSVLFFIPEAVVTHLVPNTWRIAYRQRHGRDGARSAYISDRLRRVTCASTRHRCAACRIAGVRMEVDHVIPWAGGGRTVMWNCVALCRQCNGLKLNYSRGRDGYEHYAGNRANIPAAREILARERRHRRNPLRYPRMVWALAS